MNKDHIDQSNNMLVVLDNPHEKGHQNLFLNNDKSLPFQYLSKPFCKQKKDASVHTHKNV